MPGNSFIYRAFFRQAAFLLLLSIFSYSNSLHNGFIMDDYTLLLSSIKSLDWNFSIFFHNVQGFYRPLMAVMLKAVYTCFGLHAAAYHVLNLFLFYTVCLLFLLLVRQLYLTVVENPQDQKTIERAEFISFLCAVLYCVHPINNIIVNYKTSCVTAFWLICMQLSFICFLTYLEHRRRMFCLFSVLLYAAAVLAHEISIFLPLYVLLAVYLLKKFPLRKALLSLWPYALCAALYVPLWFCFTHRRPATTAGFSYSFLPYISSLFHLLQWYVGNLFWPHNLLIAWDVPVASQETAWPVVFFAVSMEAIAWALLRLVQYQHRFEAFALSLFISGFLPLFYVAFIYTPATHNALIEPHWFYFSSIGFFMLAASFFEFISRRWGRAAKVSALLAVIIPMAAATRHSNLVWKDNDTYCRYWIKTNRINGQPYLYLKMDDVAGGYFDQGLRLAKQGDNTQALWFFNKTIETNSRYVQAYVNRGTIYAKMGDWQKAFLDYNQAIAIDPNLPEAYYNRAAAYFLLKDYDKAWADVNKTEALGMPINPQFLDALKISSGRQSSNL